jgi:hypothetical protein
MQQCPIRLGPDDDEAEVTAAQVREVITRLVEAGHWREGDPPRRCHPWFGAAAESGASAW